MDSRDLEYVENVLLDGSTPPRTRRWLLRRAAAGAAAAGAAAVVAGCGGRSSKTAGATALVGGASGAAGETAALIHTTITAEALAVTYLSRVIRTLGSTAAVRPFLPVLKAANAAEYDHFKALQALGGKPATTRFWIPDDFVAAGGVFAAIEVLETLFVNAYLIGVTTFARAGKSDLARYAGEILGVETEHRVLARFAQGKRPNDVAFEPYAITTMRGIVAALERAGFGVGRHGTKPGRFIAFRPPTADVVGPLEQAPQ